MPLGPPFSISSTVNFILTPKYNLITHNLAPFFLIVRFDQERALREMSGSPVLPPMEESSTANVRFLLLDLAGCGRRTSYLLLTLAFSLGFVVAKLSVDEDDEKLEDADEDAESEKLSQSVDNTSDKPDAPGCRLRSGIAA